MKRSILLRPLLALVGLVLPLSSIAQSSAVPDFMNYQAYVTDQNNVPLGETAPTNYTALFRIYDAATGGNILWAEQQVVTIFQGNFSVILGNGQADGSNPKPAFSSVFDSAERFMGITVNTGSAPTEFTPRQRILSNAYAHRAALAEVALSATTVEGDDLSIDSAGRVGIGTSTPITAVTISSSAVPSKGQLTLIDPNNPSTSNSPLTAIAAFGSDYGTGATGRIWYMGSASTSNKNLALLNDQSGNIAMGTNGRSDDLVISDSGDVTINNDLTVGGKVDADIEINPSSPTTNPAPTTFDSEVSFDLKNRTIVGVPGMGTQTAVMTLSQGNSGADHQVAVNAGGLFWRQAGANDSAWGSWHRLAADTYLPSSRQQRIWSNLYGGDRTLDIASALDRASVPTWATGVILKVIVRSGGSTGSLHFADETSTYSSDVHYAQIGYTNYDTDWSGGTVKVPLLNEGDGIRRTKLRFSHSSNAASPDTSVGSYAQLVGYY